MKFIGNQNEYFEIQEIDESNCHHLEETEEDVLRILWFTSDRNELIIDREKHIFNNNQIVCLTQFHHLKYLFKSIKNYLLKKSKNKTIQAPEGLCPNCWGRQEYGGKFFEAIKKEGIDVSNTDQKKGWIQDYAEKNLSSISLQAKGNKLTCNVCYQTYEQTH